METLEKLHKMDWQDMEQNDEGKGRTKDMKHTLTLVCATAQEGERKRKRGKKLRWTISAKWRAAEKGIVTRKCKRAARRLPMVQAGQCEMEWLEEEVGEEQVLGDLIENVKNLMIEESREQDKATEGIEEHLSELSLLGEANSEWEVEEHNWIESLNMDTIEVDESGRSRKWFKFDEERQEHGELENLISELMICDTGRGQQDYPYSR